MQLSLAALQKSRRLLWQLLKLSSRGTKPTLLFRSTESGLMMEVEHGALWFQQQLSQEPFPQDYRLTFTLLSELRRAIRDVEVIAGRDRLEFRWVERGGVIRQQIYEGASPGASNKPTVLPAFHWQPLSARFQQALTEASTVTDPGSLRYALGCIQLSRVEDHVAATDGRQLYLAKRIDLPEFTDSLNGEPLPDQLLVPQSPLFGLTEFWVGKRMEVALSRDWFAVRCGDTRVALRICQQGRFPEVSRVLPSPSGYRTHVTLDARDQLWLTRQLAGAHDAASPLTLELNGHVAIRTIEPNTSQPIEYQLRRSIKTGQDVCWVTHREYLQRALRWGLGELQLSRADAPVVAQDHWRTFVWMTLSPELAQQRSTAVQPLDSCATRSGERSTSLAIR